MDEVRTKRLRRLRRWGVGAALGAAVLGGLILSYVGFGSSDPAWRARLEYPNRETVREIDPGTFTSATVCAQCHQQYFAEWSASGMGQSSEVSRFLIDLYELSLDVRGAPTEDVAQCLHCHAPLSVMGPEPDLALARDLSREGVTCDVCHTAVAAHANDAPAMMQWDPKGPKRGPLPGSEDPPSEGVPAAVSPFHKTAASPLHESSELCGACHMSLWPTNALPIDWTYAEWSRSPWPARGKTCQSCHMPTYRGAAAPGAPMRDDLHRHTFLGGGDPELVRQAAEIEVTGHAHFAGHEVEVRVENTGAGHAFPTGNATAPMVLLAVTAFDAAGATVFADRREYRLIYVDKAGDVTTDPTVAERVRSDTTLQPLEPRHERFYLPKALGATRVTAELTYRRWSDDIVDNHAGLVREFVGRYLEQGVRLHRLLARLPDIDYDRLKRVREFEPILVASESVDLPAPPVAP